MNENNIHHTFISDISLMTEMIINKYEIKNTQYFKVI
jgi:hypothetical protein